MCELPRPEVIARKTTIASESVYVFSFRVGLYYLCPPYLWHVWHFQTIGHVASETDIEYGGAYVVVGHYVDHLGQQFPCLPSEGATRFKDDAEVRISFLEVCESRDEQRYVVSLSSD